MQNKLIISSCLCCAKRKRNAYAIVLRGLFIHCDRLKNYSRRVWNGRDWSYKSPLVSPSLYQLSIRRSDICMWFRELGSKRFFHDLSLVCSPTCTLFLQIFTTWKKMLAALTRGNKTWRWNQCHKLPIQKFIRCKLDKIPI